MFSLAAVSLRVSVLLFVKQKGCRSRSSRIPTTRSYCGWPLQPSPPCRARLTLLGQPSRLGDSDQMGAGWPATASFSALVQAEPKRSKGWQPSPTSLLLSAALSFSPSGAPPPPPRDWPRDPATGSTRRCDSRSARDRGFPRLGLGRHAGQPRPLRGGAAWGPPAGGCQAELGAPAWATGAGTQGARRASPAADRAQNQMLRAGTAPLHTFRGAQGCAPRKIAVLQPK